MSKRMTTALLAVLAVVALAAPAGATTANPRTEIEFDLELEIFDLHVSTACDADVFANVAGTYAVRVHRDRNGDVERLVETFRGEITWFTRGSGKSYTSELDSKTVVTFPEGVEFFKPAHIVVTGKNAGSFPIGGGPPGYGKLVYDGFIYTVDFDGVPYWTTEGDPIAVDGSFTKTSERICAALA